MTSKPFWSGLAPVHHQSCEIRSLGLATRPEATRPNSTFSSNPHLWDMSAAIRLCALLVAPGYSPQSEFSSLELRCGFRLVTCGARQLSSADRDRLSLVSFDLELLNDVDHSRVATVGVAGHIHFHGIKYCSTAVR